MSARSHYAALFLLLAGLTAGCLTSAPASQPKSNCTGKHIFIGVRGSGEHAGFGDTIGAVKDRLQQTASGFTGFEAIDYVAVDVIDPRLWGKYDASYDQGVEQLENALYLKNHQCANNTYGIAGYSQGADVVAGTLNSLWKSSSAVDRHLAVQIDAVALLGDPRYNSKDVAAAAVAHKHGIPILAVLPSDHGGVRPVFPEAFADKVRSWCLPKDLVCDLAPATAIACTTPSPLCTKLLATQTAYHLAYKKTGYTTSAADWLAHKIRSSIAPSETSPPVQPAPSDSPYAGDWHGTLLQDKKEVYTIDVHYTGGQQGEEIATVNYPTLGCSGQWLLTKASARAIVVREEITKNSHCIPEVDITLTPLGQGTLDYKISTPVSVTGQLHRR
ncbi:cutinase family protein [Streptomyces sp. NPDC005485]|uniref:cutinase family protein n=1 Tax=Streptomyces sp. NPDC005485 TaxID=3155591 RepID=UPI0033AB78DD